MRISSALEDGERVGGADDSQVENLRYSRLENLRYDQAPPTELSEFFMVELKT